MNKLEKQLNKDVVYDSDLILNCLNKKEFKTTLEVCNETKLPRRKVYKTLYRFEKQGRVEKSFVSEGVRGWKERDPNIVFLSFGNNRKPKKYSDGWERTDSYNNKRGF